MYYGLLSKNVLIRPPPPLPYARTLKFIKQTPELELELELDLPSHLITLFIFDNLNLGLPISFSVLHRPSFACNTLLGTLMSCPPFPYSMALPI